MKYHAAGQTLKIVFITIVMLAVEAGVIVMVLFEHDAAITAKDDVISRSDVWQETLPSVEQTQANGNEGTTAVTTAATAIGSDAPAQTTTTTKLKTTTTTKSQTTTTTKPRTTTTTKPRTTTTTKPQTTTTTQSRDNDSEWPPGWF